MIIKILTKKRLQHDMRMRMLLTALLVMLSFLVGMFSYAISHNYLQVPEYKYKVTTKADNSYRHGYEAGLSFARKRLEKLGLVFNLTNQLNYVQGTVKEVNGQTLKVQIPSHMIDIFAEDDPVKTVRVSSNTKMQVKLPKDEEQLREEYEILQEKYKSLQSENESISISDFEYPSPYNINKISIGDISVGDTITIESKTDIRKSDSFEAVNISLISNG